MEYCTSTSTPVGSGPAAKRNLSLSPSEMDMPTDNKESRPHESIDISSITEHSSDTTADVSPFIKLSQHDITVISNHLKALFLVEIQSSITTAIKSVVESIIPKVVIGISSAVISSPTVNPVSVIVNTTVTIQCQTSSGRPVATVAWYKNNTTPATQITSHTDTSSTQQEDLFVTHGTLRLNVQRDDKALGVYCRANGPKMRILQDHSVVEGEKFEYPCLYEPGNPPAVSFEWTRSESIASWIKQEKQNLTFSTVQRSDDANYTCNVSSILRAKLSNETLKKKTLKYDTATFHLNVMYGAENLKILLNNVSNASVEIEENTTNHLQCSLESDPASNIIIFKDERSGVHQLTHEIKSECSDTGVYTCSGYNEYGAAKNASICLFPPGVVVKRNYTARQGDNVTMSYTIVAYPLPKSSQFVWKRCTNESDGSCYSLSDKVRKFAIVTGTPTSSLTILDIQIEDYGMYQFSVHNDIGSPLIEWLHLKPIGKPDLPSDFHVIQEEISETSAVLTWVPGFDNGSPQTFYITYWKKGDSSGRITKSVEHKYEGKINYTLRNLETETEYIASINASNVEGSSPTMNDTFKTLKHIPSVQINFPIAFISGAVGGGIAVVLVIIGLIFLVKKMRISGFTKERETVGRRKRHHSSQQQDDDEVVENEIYESAGDFPQRKGSENRSDKNQAIAVEDMYAQPNKNKHLDVYAVVKKAKKKGKSTTGHNKQYDNKSFGDETYENHDLPNTKKTMNEGGLIHADVEIANPPKG
ncbi:TUTL-like protein [Mya arenaria]|uniref:TUTL-like protein n=1 Tax=Mya arenaria TaxID=6604 RepID=A0ABY7ECF3_MYAAR|nr:TUTL-like protein [Mya arenaria]